MRIRWNAGESTACRIIVESGETPQGDVEIDLGEIECDAPPRALAMAGAATAAPFTRASVHWWPCVLAEVDAVQPWTCIGEVQEVSAPDAVGDLSALHAVRHVPVDTDGDGACAIHSVFGEPTFAKRGQLFVEDARARAVATYGGSVMEFRRRLQNDIRFDSIISELWLDHLLPILFRRIGVPSVLQVRTQGEILWSHVERDERLRDDLLGHVSAAVEHQRTSDIRRSEARDCFKNICCLRYDGLLELLIARLVIEGADWEADAEPWFWQAGQRLVQGSQEPWPDAIGPMTRYDALLDVRQCFDGFRRGLLECKGGDLKAFHAVLEDVVLGYAVELAVDPHVCALRRAVSSVAQDSHGGINAPTEFSHQVWPHFLRALEHGDGLRSYWLSYSSRRHRQGEFGGRRERRRSLQTRRG